MPTVFIPPMMQRLTGGAEKVEVEGANVRQVIEALERLYPGTKAWLCEGNRLRPGVAAAIDGEIATMGLIQPVPPGSEVHFIPALGGGSETWLVLNRFSVLKGDGDAEGVRNGESCAGEGVGKGGGTAT